MSSSGDSWMKEFKEASAIAEDIHSRIGDTSLPQREISALRRKITILGTRLDSLESLLQKLPSRQPITEKELHRRQDMLVNLRSKANQMASTLKMSTVGHRDDLLGQDNKPLSEINRTTGLDNYGLVGLQRQIMKEQDEGLEKLEETVISTKHIALAVNEELDLHSHLLDSLDQDVDATSSRLQRVQRRLAVLNKKTKSACSCMCLLLMVVVIVILAVVIWALIKFL